MVGIIGLPVAVLSGLGRSYTHPGRWIHLPFRGHWPYRLRSNNGSCSRTNDWQLSMKFYLSPTQNPCLHSSKFIPHGIKASLCELLSIMMSGKLAGRQWTLIRCQPDGECLSTWYRADRSCYRHCYRPDSGDGYRPNSAPKKISHQPDSDSKHLSRRYRADKPHSRLT
jgi:hypothetical protein